MRKIRSSSLVAMAFVAILALPAGAAQSVAPRYVSSEPGDGEELHQAPDRVEVTFDEPLDQGSDLSVKDSCGRSVDNGSVSVEANTMSVGIKLKPSGHYQVTYVARGLGGITGETKGDFHFMVHLGKGCRSGSGGGHGGHGGSGGGGDKQHGSGDHGDGGGHQGGSGGDGDHSTMDHGSGSGTHSASTHTAGSNHDSMDHDSTDHDRKGGKHGKRHGKGHGKDHGKGHGKDHDPAAAPPGDEERTSAAGELGLAAAPDGAAVLLALGLSLALGVVGGWFLRVSGAQ